MRPGWTTRRGGLAWMVLACAATGAPVAAAETAATDPGREQRPQVLVVLGAAGESEYGSNFVHQAELWRRSCETALAKPVMIGLEDPAPPTDAERLKQAVAEAVAQPPAALWMVLVGHGTYDGKDARFNLRGPDVTATEVAEWLRPLSCPLVFINTASASAPFLKALSGTNRVIVTATRSGYEQNYARFGEPFAAAIASPASDLDQDGQVSLLEAFLTAAHRVAEFYHTEGRLATEHALLDDNGDGLGTPAEWFRGVRAVKKPQGGAALDGARAHQIHFIPSDAERALPAAVRQRRDALELEILRLRETKADRPEAEYYRELERLLLEMARLLESADQQR